MFSSFRKGPDDPMYFLKLAADEDTSKDKVDLGVEIYRNEGGLYSQLGCVAKPAKPPYVASVQTISGTGAVHLAALALSQSISPRPLVYVGTPTWGNCKPMFELVGLEVVEYPIEEDAYALRHFATLGIDMFVCQSFSKNFAFPEIAAVVQDRLRCLIRWEFSSSPAYGCRLATIVLDSDALAADWVQELSDIQLRLKALRKELHHTLTQTPKTPGDWGHVLRENGLFSYLNLTYQQCQKLTDQHHIYLPPNGRINISGLNETNIERVAGALDEVIRGEIGQKMQTRAAL
ncbi:aspartate aminotransferase cytoplasmic [Fusarium phyllophilum]|uniref:Aspartate aminotransferase cytoplasmic n=1 Tax=Fusarium phyllophilum TaxID=47803 RepID=A0A8H5K6Y2_9HYPO|nr:aspartate aminotransferase cytoplasmic [Fusarium phyllophilum]